MKEEIQIPKTIEGLREALFDEINSYEAEKETYSELAQWRSYPLKRKTEIRIAARQRKVLSL